MFLTIGQDGKFTEIYGAFDVRSSFLCASKLMFIAAVEYRLLQFAPFPGAVQDAAAVYNLICNRYGKKLSLHQHNNDSNCCIGKTSTGGGCKIVLIGDSAGGNLVLSLARWLRDEEHFPRPDGLLLLSVSVCVDLLRAFD
jgi:acetyl esterase/lipase